MAALEYIQLPAGATRLRASSSSSRSNSLDTGKPSTSSSAATASSSSSSSKSSTTSTSSSKNPPPPLTANNSTNNSKTLPADLRPAPQVYTSLPNPSPPPSPAFNNPKRRPSMLLTPAGATMALSSPVLSLIPQMFMGSIPTSPSGGSFAGSGTGASSSNPNAAASDAGIGVTPPTPTGAGAGATSSNPRRKIESEPVTLLSSKDPLSLPIMSTNFRRFVSIVGPVFWVQDRVEEILLWKRGWLRTAVWLAAYTFLCFYPRMIFMLPHVALIAIILATYPYPPRVPDEVFSLDHLSDSSSKAPTAPAPPAVEGSVPWQANIQGIQNLMGATADAHDLIEPYLYHLNLTPAHLTTTRLRTGPGTAFHTHFSPNARSPYTAHILAILLVSFFPMLFLISLPIFPVRELCIVAGLLPFLFTHPYVRPLLPHLAQSLVSLAPIAIAYTQQLYERITNPENVPQWVRSSSVYKSIFSPTRKPTSSSLGGFEKYHMLGHGASDEDDTAAAPLPLKMAIQRVIDNDRLSDECWEADMREVELWENERYGGVIADAVGGGSGSLTASTSGSSTSSGGSGGGSGAGASVGAPQKGWSKANLRLGERAGWTRGRDGSNAVGSVDGSGDVSSNLTFPLAPGWSFVETEDWRKDVRVAWSGCFGDPDGWVYTNDSWLGSRPAPYTSGGGSVTRRRRWIRRVWYDPVRARAEM